MKNILYKTGKILILLYFLLLSMSCIDVAPYIKNTHTEPEKPQKEDINVEVSIEKGKIIDFSMNGLNMGFTLTVINNNNYALDLSEFKYQVDIEGNTINSEQETGVLSIPSKEAQAIERSFYVDFVNLAKGIISFGEKQNLAYSVTGDCQFTGNSNTNTKSVHITGTIPVPQLPSLSLSKTGIETIDIYGFSYNVQVKIENPNPFWLEIKGFDYDMLIKDNSLFKITNNDIQKIDANSESFIDIPLVVTFTDVIKILPDLFSMEKLDFKFQGNVQYDSFIGNVDAPFHVDDTITLPKPPQIKVTGIKPIIGLPPKLSVTIDTYNPNDFDIKISLFEFAIFISGSEIIKSKKENIFLMSGKTNKITLNAEITADILNNLRKKNQAGYRIKGKFSFTSIMGTLTIPFDISDVSGIL